MSRLVSAAVALAVSSACLAASAPAMLAAGAPANLIQNGSFEQPAVPNGSYVLVAAGQTLPGWRVVGATGNVAPISGTFMQSGLDFLAESGRQWLDLTGVSNSRTGVSQTVNTKPGATYSLSFWVGNVYDPGGIFGVKSTVDVLLDGELRLAATNSGGRNTHNQVWKWFELNFKAASAATTIEFLNGDSSTDNSNGLDAVSLT
jgi:hypothetical protein